jgi:hypothetical protein
MMIDLAARGRDVVGLSVVHQGRRESKENGADAREESTRKRSGCYCVTQD